MESDIFEADYQTFYGSPSHDIWQSTGYDIFRDAHYDFRCISMINNLNIHQGTS
jgi:hypothetical protein